MVDGTPVANGDFNTGITVSNGGLNATVDDLARWIGFLTGEIDAPILSRESLAEMWRQVVPVRDMELGKESMGLTFWLYPDRDLVGHTGKAVSRADLIREVWGFESDATSNVVDAVVATLRRKLGPRAQLIETVRGTGYRLRNG